MNERERRLEHPTLNIQRPTSNLKNSNLRGSRFNVRRSMFIPLSFSLSLLLPLTGCHPPPEHAQPTSQLDPSQISGTRTFEDVRQIVAITPRHSGSEGATRAATHLRTTLAPFVDTSNLDTFTSETPHGSVTFRNVIGIRLGQGSNLVILASHYDTKSGISDTFQGANDSGSSSGLLIEIARVLHAQDTLPFSVMFAFFDGEECMEEYGESDGLHGSRQLVQQLREQDNLTNVKAMILLDMIGDRDLTITVPRNSDRKLMAMTFDAARAVDIRNKFSLARYTILDDHVPFLEAGIPAIDLIDFQHGSQHGLNDYWHTENDSLEHISAESLQSMGEVVIHMLNALAAESLTAP